MSGQENPSVGFPIDDAVRGREPINAQETGCVASLYRRRHRAWLASGTVCLDCETLSVLVDGKSVLKRWRIRKLRRDRHLEQTAAMMQPRVIGKEGKGGRRLARTF